MNVSKFSINSVEKIYLILSIGFACLGWSEWIKASAPSGRWGWLRLLAEDLFGPSGYVKLLVVLSLVWFFAFFVSVKSRNGQTKGVDK